MFILLPDNYVSRILQEKFNIMNVDIWNFIDDSNKRIIRALSWEEFQFTIKNLKVKSAHGLDLISNMVISKLPESSLKFFFKLFNKIFNLSIFLEEWKNYFMIFIPKNDGRNYRPISLANNIFKIFEKILQTRLDWNTIHSLPHVNLVSVVVVVSPTILPIYILTFEVVSFAKLIPVYFFLISKVLLTTFVQKFYYLY